MLYHVVNSTLPASVDVVRGWEANLQLETWGVICVTGLLQCCAFHEILAQYVVEQPEASPLAIFSWCL